MRGRPDTVEQRHGGGHGHVSMRVDGERNFWVTGFEYFDQTTPEGVCKLDYELNVLRYEQLGVRVAEVTQMDMSRQSEKPNAMFTGLGNTKRIVLGANVLEGEFG